jgi:FkbM family methyltransferase
MMAVKARVKTWLKRRLHVPAIELALERLVDSGFRPKLIFDVGAYRGDFVRTCRSLWEDSRVACFEVQPEPFRRLVAAFANDTKVCAWPCLLGAVPQETVTLHLSDTGSSVLEENVPQDLPIAHFPMRTVDEVVQREYAGQAPELLKLDVQGYELEVIRGSEKSLGQIAVILAEVNLIDIYKGVPLVGEIMEWLGQRGWVVFDICGLTRRPLDEALWQADFIFVPKGSPLRADKRWDK